MSLGAKYLIFAVLCFNFMQVCVKLLTHIPFYELIFFRALISLTFSFIWLKFNHIPMWGHNRPLLIARGVFGALALSAYFFALQRAPLALVVSLQDLSPFFSLLFALIILKEPTPMKQWPFFLVALLGVVILRGFSSEDRIDNLSFYMALLSAVGAGVAYSLVRLLARTEHSQVVVFYFPLVTLPLVTPMTITHWVQPEGLQWLTLFGIGLFTHVAQVALTKSFQLEKLNHVIIYKYLGPIFATLLGILIFKDFPAATEILGIGFILLAVILMKVFSTRDPTIT